MYSDIREYNYYDNGTLINRVSQVEEYLDKKFADIHMDVDLSEIEEKITDATIDVKENISEAKDDIKTTISSTESEIKEDMANSVTEIKDAIETAKPCLCNLATKEDVCNAKCTIIRWMEDNKDEIIKEIDEKFVDLNELVKNK